MTFPSTARLVRSLALSLLTFGLVGATLTGCAATVRYAPRPVAARSAVEGGTDSPVGRLAEGGSVAARRDAMMEEVERWLGTPYRHGRETVGRGTDCSGFTSQVYLQVLGLRLPRNSGEQYGQGVAVERDALEFGDLVFFGSARGRVTHVGMYVGDGKFAHASSSRGVVIDPMSETYFANRYLGARRYGLETNEQSLLDPVTRPVQVSLRPDRLHAPVGLIEPMPDLF